MNTFEHVCTFVSLIPGRGPVTLARERSWPHIVRRSELALHVPRTRAHTLEGIVNAAEAQQQEDRDSEEDGQESREDTSEEDGEPSLAAALQGRALGYSGEGCIRDARYPQGRAAGRV
jgi:hypothetical protein